MIVMQLSMLPYLVEHISEGKLQQWIPYKKEMESFFSIYRKRVQSQILISKLQASLKKIGILNISKSLKYQYP